MEIKLKRIYQAKEDADGFRILVDKIYPRGIKKENLDVDLWDKEIAPMLCARLSTQVMTLRPLRLPIGRNSLRIRT